MAHDADFRRELGQQLRVDSVRASARRRLGPPDLLDVGRRPDGRAASTAICGSTTQHPENPANDHLIFSKGHASPLYYSMLKAVGAIDDEELLTFRKLGSPARGPPDAAHPADRRRHRLARPGPADRRRPGASPASSLDRLPYRVWVLCGDSEMAEGSMWEAFQHAGWEGLDNLTAIVDVNRLGQTRETMLGWDLDGYVRRAEAFGWHAIEIDGHDVEAIEAGLRARPSSDHGPPDGDPRPHQEGQGRQGGRGPARQARQAARRPRGGDRGARRRARPARRRGQAARAGEPHVFETAGGELPSWELGEEVATRKAYGEALAALGNVRGDVVALDGEVSNSTHSEDFRGGPPGPLLRDVHRRAADGRGRGRACRCAAGCRSPRRSPRSSRAPTTSSAWPRSRGPTSGWSGSHAGVSIGEDGPSQMALEDIAVDARDPRLDRPAPERRQPDREARGRDGRPRRASRSCARCAARRRCAPRRTRSVQIGGSRVAGRAATTSRSWPAGSRSTRRSRRPSSSPTTASTRACSTATRSSRSTPRPCAAAARDCGAIVTVEDHWPEGGLGDAVLEALADGDEHAARWSGSRCARCRPPARPRSCCTPPGSTPRRSRAPPASWRGREPEPRARRSRPRSRRRAPPRGRGRCTGTGRPPRGRPGSPASSGCAPQTAHSRAMVSSRVRSSRSMRRTVARMRRRARATAAPVAAISHHASRNTSGPPAASSATSTEMPSTAPSWRAQALIALPVAKRAGGSSATAALPKPA